MGAGHASTSIGYAVGVKEAMRKGIGEDGQVVAVIGDGALTGGVAYEALQNAGGLETPIVIVLNDNGMSISPNVGALARYFQRFRLNPHAVPRPRGGRGSANPAAARGRADRAAGPGDQVGNQVLRRPGVAVRGAGPRLRRGDRRPRRRRAAARDRRCDERRAAGGRPHPHREGEGIHPSGGGRLGGHGEVACGEAREHREPGAGGVRSRPPAVGWEAPGRRVGKPTRPRRSRSSSHLPLRRRPSTRRCSPTPSSPRPSGTAA